MNGSAHPLNSSEQALVQPGLYRHYKGNLYEVLGIVMHSETEELLVLYRALYGERKLWVRPQALFVQKVYINGTSFPRFEQVLNTTDSQS
jgi:hypothetical protein